MTVGPLIHCGLLVQVGAIYQAHGPGRDSSRGIESPRENEP